MKTFLMMLAAIALCAVTLRAQESGETQTPPLRPTEQAATIENIAQMLERYYIFPDTARKTAAVLREKARLGKYNAVADGARLAETLTADLQAATGDRHLRVEFSAEVLPLDKPFSFDYAPDEIALMRKIMSKDNFGLGKIEFLPGNVGYLKINRFAPLAVAAQTYSAALNTIADADALILDLRENGGSLSPDTIPYLAGYFFENPVHLSDVYWANERQTRQYWSAAQVAGRKYLDKPLYILISRQTFSGAEEFAYDFKHLKRAVIVGETSGGGANPGGMRRVGDHFTMYVSFGKVTNPITKTNWEGAGVAPDIATNPADAIGAAHNLALEQIEAGSENHLEWQQYIKQLRRETAQKTAKK